MGRSDTLQVNGHPMRVYLDVPAGGGTRPGVVVMIHGPGLDKFIETQVEDLARHGYIAAAPDLFHRQAAGGFYGGNIMKPWGDGPAPFDLTSRITCPIVGFFGADDTNPSPEDVMKIDAELTKHGKPHEFHMYEGAGHAFLNFMNAERHRPKQAAEAWPKMLAFLDQHVARSGS